MKSALDIAYYFLCRIDREAGDTISSLKLQKLVYYAQAWSLVFRGQPLFHENIEAWVHGPVVREVWNAYREYKHTAIPEPERPLPVFDGSELEVLDEVWDVYGELSARQLEELTHAELPWRAARQGLAPDERSNNPITHEDMRAYYIQFLEES